MSDEESVPEHIALQAGAEARYRAASTEYYFIPAENIWDEQPDGSRKLIAAKGVPIIRELARAMGLDPDKADSAARRDQIRREMETELRHYLDKQYTHASYAVEIEDLRQRLAESDAERERLARKDLYDRVIERFNRSHSHRKKTTLREICDQMGVSYEAVRKYRLRTGKRKE